MPFVDNSDPNVAPGEYETCPKGRYEIIKIEPLGEKYQDEFGYPIYVPVSWRDESVAKLRLIRLDGPPHPVYIATASEILLMARAFGVDVAKLPKDRHHPDFLVRVVDAINATETTVFVVLRAESFVAWVEGAHPPAGTYMVSFVDVYSAEDPPQFHDDPWGNRSVSFAFEIVGGASGKRNMFNGCRLTTYVRDPFEGVDSDTGDPILKVNSNGSKPMDVLRFEHFMNVFCPGIYEYEWKTMDQAGFDEASNPLAVVVRLAKENNNTGFIHYGMNQNGKMVIDLMTLTAESESYDVEEDSSESGPSESVHSTRPQLMRLTSFLEEQHQIFTEWPDNLSLNEKGKQWAGEELTQAWLKAKISPSKRSFSDLSEEEAVRLYAVFNPEDELSWS